MLLGFKYFVRGEYRLSLVFCVLFIKRHIQATTLLRWLNEENPDSSVGLVT